VTIAPLPAGDAKPGAVDAPASRNRCEVIDPCVVPVPRPPSDHRVLARHVATRVGRPATPDQPAAGASFARP
jgi:hypothetical protein